MIKNAPFVFGKIVTGEAFTDRLKETENLKTNFSYGTNTILISPRRMGKTSLVRKAARLAETESVRIAFFDAFSCRNEADFLNVYAAAVVKSTSSRWEEWMRVVSQFLSRLTPKITIGTDPAASFDIEFALADLEKSAEDILALPQKIAEAKNIRIVVCIDEFQQIGSFEQSLAFQKRLRGSWQQQSNVCFCLFGSKKHMMNTMFQRQDYPFYRFGDIMYLSRIPRDDWVAFICERFALGGKTISQSLAGQLVDAVEAHSSYVQQLAWILWSSVAQEATDEDLKAALERLLDSCQPTFIVQTEGLSTKQLGLLRAICDGVEEGFTTKKVLEKYRLGVSSNVVRVRDALLERDLVSQQADKRLVIEDPVFKLWMIERFNAGGF